MHIFHIWLNTMKKEINFFKYVFRGFWAAGFLVVFLFGGNVLAQTWVNPTADPPNNNPAGFILANPTTEQNAFIDITQPTGDDAISLQSGDIRLFNGELCFGQPGADECLSFGNLGSGSEIFTHDPGAGLIFSNISQTGSIFGQDNAHVILTDGSDPPVENFSKVQAFNRDDWIEIRSEIDESVTGGTPTINALRWGNEGDDIFKIQHWNDLLAMSSNTALTITPWQADLSGAPLPGGGFVGIGTEVPEEKLHIAGNVLLEANSPLLRLDGISGVNKQIDFQTNGITGWRVFEFNDGDFRINRHQEGTGTFQGVPFAISRSTGNVGIGITNPQEQLHVQNDIRLDGGRILFGGTGHRIVERADLSGWHLISDYDNGSGGTTNSLGLIDKTGTPLGYFWGTKTSDGSAITSGFLDGDGQWSFLMQKDSHTAFRVNNSEKMRITSAGTVGIGTPTPLAGLEINAQAAPQWSSFNLGANVVVRGAGRNNTVGFISSTGEYSWAMGARNDGTFRTSIMPPLGDTSVPPQDVITVNQAGNVGVGTVNPENRLHVASGSAGTVAAGGSFDDLVIENSSSAGFSILTTDAGAAGFYLGSPSDNIGAQMFWQYNANLMRLGTHRAGADLILEAGLGSEAVRIDGGTGNVGIGTVNPQSKLHVAGSVDLGARRSSLGVSSINIWNAATFQPAAGTPLNEGGEFRMMGNPDNANARSFIVDSFKETMRIFPLVSTAPQTSIINLWHNNQGGFDTEGRVGINMSANGAVPASALQVNGTVRASQYCSYDGTVCFLAEDVGSGGGGTDQNLQQVLTVGNDAGQLNITNLNRLSTDEICLGGDCQTTWPSGGSGGVTKIIAGDNVTISPTGGTGDVTINANVVSGETCNVSSANIECHFSGSATGVSCSALCPGNQASCDDWVLTEWDCFPTGSQTTISNNQGICENSGIEVWGQGTCTR